MNAPWIRLVFVCVGLVFLASCVREPEPIGYVLEIVAQPGDTLPKICQRYQVAISTVWEYNNLSTTILKPGQHLLLPGAKPPKRQVQVFAPLPPPPILPIETSTRVVVPTPPPPPPVSRFVLVSRDEWGALPAKGNCEPMNGVSAITVHHTTEHGLTTKSDIDAVRAIARNHRNVNGWADVGYHFLVGRDGKVYEGRAIDLQGAHCGGVNNKHNVGVSLIGDFTRHEPSGIQEAALIAVLAELREKYNVPKSKLFGHGELPNTNTQCPGEAMLGWLHRYKQSN